MNNQQTDYGWPHPQHLRNRQNVPKEEVWRYIGQHVAWSWDGTEILAAGPDEDVLQQKLVAAGIDPSHVVYSYVNDPDVSLL